MADFCIKTSDQLPELEATLERKDGTAVDLTGCSVSLVWVNRTTGARKSGNAVVVSTAGDVKYSWVSGDLPVPGDYQAEWVATYPDGKTETFPNYSYIEIKVLASL
jgi:hypothetical protein